MNKILKVSWRKANGAGTVVQEFAKTTTKATSTVRKAFAIAGLSMLCVFSLIGTLPVHANTMMTGDGLIITSIDSSKPFVSLLWSGLDNGGSKITNVAVGTDDTDAVNVGQLKDAIKNSPSSTWTLETDSGAGDRSSVVNGTAVSLKGDGNISVVNSGTNVTVKLNDSITIGTADGKKVVVDGNNGIATIGGVTVNGGTNASIGGLSNTFYKPGETGVNGREGIVATEGQLQDVSHQFDNRMGEMGGRINKAGSHAAALTGLKPIQYDPLEPTQIMAAVGNYHGSTSAAIGLAHYTSEDTMFHVGVAVGGDDTMVNAGVTRKFGSRPEKKAIPERYKAGPISSVYVMQDEVIALKAENIRMKARDEQLTVEYESLKKDNEEMKAKLAILMQKMGL